MRNTITWPEYTLQFFKWFEKQCPLILLWGFHNFLGFSSCFLITGPASLSSQTETGTLDGGCGKLIRRKNKQKVLFPCFFFFSLQICSLYSWFGACNAGTLSGSSNSSFSSDVIPSLESLQVELTAGKWIDGPLYRFPHSYGTSG